MDYVPTVDLSLRNGHTLLSLPAFGEIDQTRKLLNHEEARDQVKEVGGRVNDTHIRTP